MPGLKRQMQYILLACFLSSGIWTSSGCSHRDYHTVLTSVNEVLIVRSLKEISDSGSENKFLRISKRIGGEKGILYRCFYRFSGNRRMKAYVPLIEKLTNQTHSSAVRCEAIRTLGQMNVWESAHLFEGLLKDQDPSVVRSTIITIARFGRPDFVPLLKPLLQDPRLKTHAIWCVGEIGRPGDAALITPFLGDREPDVAFIALKALNGME